MITPINNSTTNFELPNFDQSQSNISELPTTDKISQISLKPVIGQHTADFGPSRVQGTASSNQFPTTTENEVVEKKQGLFAKFIRWIIGIFTGRTAKHKKITESRITVVKEFITNCNNAGFKNMSGKKLEQDLAPVEKMIDYCDELCKKSKFKSHKQIINQLKEDIVSIKKEILEFIEISRTNGSEGFSEEDIEACEFSHKLDEVKCDIENDAKEADINSFLQPDDDMPVTEDEFAAAERQNIQHSVSNLTTEQSTARYEFLNDVIEDIMKEQDAIYANAEKLPGTARVQIIQLLNQKCVENQININELLTNPIFKARLEQFQPFKDAISIMSNF